MQFPEQVAHSIHAVWAQSMGHAIVLHTPESVVVGQATPPAETDVETVRVRNIDPELQLFVQLDHGVHALTCAGVHAQVGGWVPLRVRMGMCARMWWHKQWGQTRQCRERAGVLWRHARGERTGRGNRDSQGSRDMCSGRHGVGHVVRYAVRHRSCMTYMVRHVVRHVVRSKVRLVRHVREGRTGRGSRDSQGQPRPA